MSTPSAGEILAGQPERDRRGDEVLALVGGGFAIRESR